MRKITTSSTKLTELRQERNTDSTKLACIELHGLISQRADSVAAAQALQI